LIALVFCFEKWKKDAHAQVETIEHHIGHHRKRN